MVGTSLDSNMFNSKNCALTGAKSNIFFPGDRTSPVVNWPSDAKTIPSIAAKPRISVIADSLCGNCCVSAHYNSF